MLSLGGGVNFITLVDIEMSDGLECLLMSEKIYEKYSIFRDAIDDISTNHYCGYMM